jgi:lipoate-protein ligase A
MAKLKILLSDSFNPYFNLAVERWLFETLETDCQLLYLWRNHDTVVIGRSQNPWLECDLVKMQADEVSLVRRLTGGGAVFHDLGNTNFSFISPESAHNKQVNGAIIIAALQRLQLKAELAGRNDIIVQHPTTGESRKISGSAYRIAGGRALQHGTLLLSADLLRLSEYLKPRPKKLLAKGITSVRSRVMNLSDMRPDIEHSSICEAIIQSFAAHYNEPVTVEELATDKLKELTAIKSYIDELSHWDWQYAKTLPFTHHLEQQFAWGGLDILLQVNQGQITSIKVYSDALHPEIAESIEVKLADMRYCPTALQQAFIELANSHPTFKQEYQACLQWLLAEIG